MTSQSKNNRLLPLTVIEAAAGGDVEAINAVLKHYAGYIARLSMRELYDEYGNPHHVYPRGYAERQIPRRNASVAACRRRRAKHIMIRPYSHSPSVQSVAGNG